MPSSTIEKMVSSINGSTHYQGVAHSNKYMVNIAAPFGMTGEEAEGLSLRCDAVNMPGRTMNTTPNAERYGPMTQMVDGWSYEDVNCSFLADKNFNIRNFFSTWQHQIYDADNPVFATRPKPTFLMNFYDDYIGTVEIILLDNNEKARYGVKLLEAFPKTINANEFNMASSNELQKISVSFAYRYWEEIQVEAQFVDEPGGRSTPLEKTSMNSFYPNSHDYYNYPTNDTKIEPLNSLY